MRHSQEILKTLVADGNQQVIEALTTELDDLQERVVHLKELLGVDQPALSAKRERRKKVTEPAFNND